ncbi:hypothetical protein OS11_16620 [Dickeya oryzae]
MCWWEHQRFIDWENNNEVAGMKVRALYALTPLFLFTQADAADSTNKNDSEMVVTASRTDTEKKRFASGCNHYY